MVGVIKSNNKSPKGFMINLINTMSYMYFYNFQKFYDKILEKS